MPPIREQADRPSEAGLTVLLPPVYGIRERRLGNMVYQLAQPLSTIRGALAEVPFRRGRAHPVSGESGDRILVVPRATVAPPEFASVLLAVVSPAIDGVVDLSGGKWLRHPLEQSTPNPPSRRRVIQEVLDSWVGAFAYTEESRTTGREGLRRPQIGALHAIHAHWSVTTAAATVVMPTGTGKTETMLATLVSTPCPQLLVVVPSDALRTQLADKFISLGLLKNESLGLLSDGAQRPVVAILQRVPRTPDEVDEVFGNAQVIVTTSAIAGRCSQSSATAHGASLHAPLRG
jgi:hypothetical protein